MKKEFRDQRLNSTLSLPPAPAFRTFTILGAQ